MTLIVSLLLALSTASIVSESAQTADLDMSASFVSAQSENAFQWASQIPEHSGDLLQKFSEVPSLTSPPLRFQQGIELYSQIERGAPGAPFPIFRDSSFDVLLYDVVPDETIDRIAFDACDSSPENACPEFVLEWFRFQKGFQFQSLRFLNAFSFDESLLDGCVDLPTFGIQRCVQRSSILSNFSELQRLPSDGVFRERWRLQVALAGYHYLFRVRSLDHSPFPFRIFGLQGGGEGEQLPLPSPFFQQRSLGQARFSQSQIREWRLTSSGLQDGLSFVHYSHEVDDK